MFSILYTSVVNQNVIFKPTIKLYRAIINYQVHVFSPVR